MKNTITNDTEPITGYIVFIFTPDRNVYILVQKLNKDVEHAKERHLIYQNLIEFYNNSFS